MVETQKVEEKPVSCKHENVNKEIWPTDNEGGIWSTGDFVCRDCGQSLTPEELDRIRPKQK